MRRRSKVSQVYAYHRHHFACHTCISAGKGSAYTGNFSSLSGMGGDTRFLQITAPMQPGNSSGPMLDAAGNLMGVVVSKLDAVKLAKITGDMAQNVNFAIHANVLRTFLDANNVDYESASSNQPLAPTAITEKARGFTALVECWK
jgi:hypothetical protein